MPERAPRIIIENVEPEVDEGRNPVKRISNESIFVQADIFADGHNEVAAVLKWRRIAPQESGWQEAPLEALGNNDRYGGKAVLEELGRYQFTIEAWLDPFATWAGEIRRKLSVQKDLRRELAEGALLLGSALERATDDREAAARLKSAHGILSQGHSKSAVALLDDRSLWQLVRRYAGREGTAAYRSFEVLVERPRAQVGTWYEFFPRSTARSAGTHGTFRDAESILPEVAAMGFDVIYLPPIHPIGSTARKGRNNTLGASRGEPGSPWAIGGPGGGHKAIHPELGTLEDFKRFLAAAARHNLEVALDIAFQVSPDHPYVKEHPEWFHHWPDGSLKTAENPPKRYEDIVHFNFDTENWSALWAELKSIVTFWCDAGIRIFRVDNPHTKPLPFWRWLLREVQNAYPDAVFLSEAFTRPKIMKALAKLGFSQSYTYFTWRNSKWELETYLKELTQSPLAEYMRGNLWPNTPDIFPQILQLGGPAAFKFRYALAATLSSSCGIYRGYEFCEGRPVAGREEYADSEKYELRPWAAAARHDIRHFIGRLNQIRREHPALHGYRNLKFYHCDNDRVLFYGKAREREQLLIAVSLDPFSPQLANLKIPHADIGSRPETSLEALDLISNTRALWQGNNAEVHLTPEAPAAIWSIERLDQSETSFDYYY